MFVGPSGSDKASMSGRADTESRPLFDTLGGAIRYWTTSVELGVMLYGALSEVGYRGADDEAISRRKSVLWMGDERKHDGAEPKWLANTLGSANLPRLEYAIHVTECTHTLAKSWHEIAIRAQHPPKDIAHWCFQSLHHTIPLILPT